MNDLFAHIKTIQKVFIFFLFFCLIFWVLMDQYKSYFAGLMLGSFVSLINAQYLAWKINQIVELSLNQSKKRRYGIGFLTRSATAALAGVITFKYGEHLNIFTVMIGLTFAHLVGYLILIYKKSNN